MPRGRWILLCALACFSALAAPFAPLAASGPPPPAGPGDPQPASSVQPPVAAALPPVALHPKSAASLAESKRLAAEAARTQDDAENARLLRRAIEIEPANHAARLAFADALLEDHPEEALAILTALRTALVNTGCRECLLDLTGLLWNDAERTNDQAVREKLRQLATGVHGSPTRVTAAGEAVWKAFTNGDWRQLAPYLGPMTHVHVAGGLSDRPLDRTERLSPRALRSWFNRIRGYDLRRGDNWFCDARCCEYWSANPSRGDVWFSLTRACFATTGARPTLIRLDWEDA